VNRSTGWRFHCAPLRRHEPSETGFSPRPESGGFRSGCALPLHRSLAPRNRRTHAAPDSSFSLSRKAAAFRLLALVLRLRANVFAALALRFCAYAPGERFTSQLSG